MVYSTLLSSRTSYSPAKTQLKYHFLYELLEIPSRIYHLIFCLEHTVEFLTLACVYWFTCLVPFLDYELHEDICPFMVISSGPHTVFIKK